jgi:hypothetical protein
MINNSSTGRLLDVFLPRVVCWCSEDVENVLAKATTAGSVASAGALGFISASWMSYTLDYQYA